MKYNLTIFEDLVRDGYLKKAEKDDLVLFGYTDKCTFERAWSTVYTLHARGLILNKKTGDVIAKPFPKFFNLGEMEQTQLKNLPNERYQVFEKCDGSLGILFLHNNEWCVATRGSFSSEQAIRGLEILRKKYNTSRLDERYTYLVEIIYPENKIIVNYGEEEKLVMLGQYHNESCEEVIFTSVKYTANEIGMPYAKEYGYTIEETIALQKTLPKDDEGFVVRFESGLRVKIKGDEYMRIAKMISQMSPLSFWEAMKNGKVDRGYVMQLPEEFRKEYEPMIDKLEEKYSSMQNEIIEDLKKIPQFPDGIDNPSGRKHVALFIQATNDLKHPRAMFQALYGEDFADKYVMKQIRPTGNVL